MVPPPGVAQAACAAARRPRPGRRATVRPPPRRRLSPARPPSRGRRQSPSCAARQRDRCLPPPLAAVTRPLHEARRTSHTQAPRSRQRCMHRRPKSPQQAAPCDRTSRTALIEAGLRRYTSGRPTPPSRASYTLTLLSRALLARLKAFQKNRYSDATKFSGGGHARYAECRPLLRPPAPRARRCRRPSRRPNARVSADEMLTSTASTVGCCAVRAASRGWSLAVAACTSDKVRTRSCGCPTSRAARRMLRRWRRRRMLPRRRLRGIGPSSSTRGGGAWPTWRRCHGVSKRCPCGHHASRAAGWPRGWLKLRSARGMVCH